ncbi:MAG: hypothetical protein CME69_05770 [Halobacteriovorax sp.]|nr:hypothetical protein [Halobacteriovorax sp.]MEE3080302.1 flagellar biosynthetic protein FliR [Bdellovibrionota bacterium]
MTIEITNIVPIIAFWLVFTRMLAINFQLPIYDEMPIPMIVKVLTTLVISFCFYPYVSGQVIRDINFVGQDSFWLLTIAYSVVGLTIGFMVKAIMSLFISSGSIISQQVGFAAVRYFDPSSNTQVGPFEQVIKWTILVTIVSSGALLPMFKGIYQSFFTITLVDLGSFSKSPIFFIEMFKSLFVSSILLASPLIFTNMLIMTVLGIIARTVPQMNVIMVSFAVTIGLGLIVFVATSDEFFHIAYKLYTSKLGEWFNFVI